MVKSKAWNWEMVDDDSDSIWKNPTLESYYLVHRWNTQKKKTFLDLGCGLGRHTVMFAGLGYKTYAFDLSPNAIERTKEWCNNLGLDVKYKVGDMLDLPYKANFFDCILCMNVISHTDTKGVRKIADRIYDILKDGGECYLTLASKDTWGFRQDWPVVDENTKIRIEDGPENGIPHFYADYELIKDIFSKFKILRVRHIGDCEKDYEEESVSYHYHILIKKVKKD